jgi:hypothetical protein
MVGGELLRVFHIHRFAGLEIEHHFMLGAMVFKRAADIFRPAQQQQETHKKSDADHAIHGVEQNLALQNGRPVGQIFSQFQGQQLIQKNKK